MSRIILNGSTTTPAAPASGKVTMFLDNGDLRVKTIDENSVVRFLASPNSRDNLIINGGFDFAQRQVPGTLTTYSNTTGRTLSADRWGITNETASTQYKRVDNITAAEDGLTSRYHGHFAKITSNGKMVISQVVEGVHIAPVRGQFVRLSAKVKYITNSLPLRMVLLYLGSGGTVDTMPATFISAFGAASVDPTWGTNLVAITPTFAENGIIERSGITSTLTTSWMRISGVYEIPTTALNLIPVFFQDDAGSNGDDIRIGEVSLSLDLMDWYPRTQAEEFAMCQRYYAKTFDAAVAPAQSAGVSGALRGGVAIAGAVATSSVMQWRFPVQMRTAPTLVFFNPSAANAFVRNVPRATDATVTAAASTNSDCTDINATGLAAWTVGDQLKVHATADAEI